MPRTAMLDASLAPPTPVVLERLPELLAFRAEYLEAKLMKESVVATPEEGAALFQEVKKYLVLFRNDSSRRVPMFSKRVHEAWMQFVLYTFEYRRFCQQFFGEFVHHVGAAPVRDTDARPRLTFERFRAEYEALFGPLSELWLDELALSTDSCVQRSPELGQLDVRIEGGRAQLVAEGERVLLRASDIVLSALRFVATHETFFVRELPGGLTADEKLALAGALFRARALHLVP